MPPNRVTLTLPVPPSANRLWRNGRGRTYKSEPARAFAAEVLAICYKAGHTRPRWPKDTPLRVTMTWYRAIKRGDLDNKAKALLDSLRGLVIVDDAQVCELHLYRVDGQRPGRCEVIVEAA